MKTAYVFRGSPASGKGTLTKEFIKLLPGKVARLELDQFRWDFHLYNRKPSEVTNEEHLFAYQNFLVMLNQYCASGNYTLVLEGLFSANKPGPHGNVADIVAILKKYHFEYKNILLYADYDVLWQRNLKREYVVPEYEFKDLYSYVTDGESEDEHRVNVSGSVEETVMALKQII